MPVTVVFDLFDALFCPRDGLVTLLWPMIPGATQVAKAWAVRLVQSI